MSTIEEQNAPATPSAVEAHGGTQLSHGVVALWQLVYQGVVGAGPAVTVALNFGAGVGLAALGFPLSMAIGTVTVLLVAISVAQFARHLPSAGGFFTYVSHGLGSEAGFLTGWAATLYGLLFPAVPTMIMANLMPDYLDRLIGVRISWWVWELLFLAVVWWFAFAGVRRSIRFMVVAGTIEVAIVAVIAIGTFIDHGSDITLDVFTVGDTGWNGIWLGLIFVFLSFAGFEGVATLAEEAEQPRRNVGRAVILSVLILGVLYTFVAWAGLTGFGNNTGAFTDDGNPFDTLASNLWDPLWAILALAILNSALAGGTAGMVFGSRYLYALGRIGLAPAALGRLDERRQTPAVALGLMIGLSVVLAMVFGAWLGPVDAFSLLGTTLTVAVLLLYFAAQLALPAFYWREHRSEFNLVLHAVVPLTAAVIIFFAFRSLVWPHLPPSPIRYAFPAAGAWMAIGVGIVAWLRVRRPEALAAARAEMGVGGAH
jgi:amino acid transporter